MKRFLPVLCACLCLVMMLASCASRHYDESNIDKLYDREWIIGKTETEIIRRYGEFKRIYERDGGHTGAYYVNYDNRGIDPSYLHDTYFIEFGEDRIAFDAYFRNTSKGG